MMKKSDSNKTEQIVDRILSYIIDNKLGENDKLPSEEQMADQFGCSRVCIREALRGLKFLGLLETGTRSGTHIRQVEYSLLSRVLGFQIATSDKSYYQLLEARLSLELSVLELVDKRATKEQLKKLEELADCTRKDNSPEELERTHIRDCAFHRYLMEISGNSVLASFSRLLEIFFLRRYVADDLNYGASQDHLNIVIALRHHNLELARGIMRKHLGKNKND